MRLLLVFVTAFAAFSQQPLDNKTITELYKQGVSAEELARMACAADTYSFRMDQSSIYPMLGAGVPESVVKAMSARLSGRCSVTSTESGFVVSAGPQTQKLSAPSSAGPKSSNPSTVEGPQFFVGYSYLNADAGAGATASANGWLSSVSVPVWGPISAEGEVSGYYKRYDLGYLGTAKGSAYLFSGGPRFTHGMFYAHSLVGGDHLSGSAVGLNGGANGFAVVIGGGVIFKLGTHWGMRAGGDYVMTEHFGYTQNHLRLAAGFHYQASSKIIGR